MSSETLSVVAGFFDGTGTIVLSFLSGSAVVGFLGFRNQLRLQKIRWLQELYSDFYSSDHYRQVRQRIDFADIDDLVLLLDKSDSDPKSLSQTERAQVDQFTDYLNFFEWIAFLEKKGQFSLEDVNDLFKYYLVRLLQVDKGQRLRKYIKEHGYEQFHKLLNHYSFVRE